MATILSQGARNIKQPGGGGGFANYGGATAAGDGVADDTQALLDAINIGRYRAANSFAPVAIYIPPGTYLVKSTILIYGNTFLFGEDTNRPTIKLANSSPNFQSPIVQSKAAGIVNGNVTTQSVTLNVNTTAGNYLVAIINCYQSPFVTVAGIAATGGASAAFTKDVSRNDGGTRDSEIWHAPIVTGGPTTVTVTFSAASSYNDLNLYEVSGLTGVLDGTNSSTATSSNETSGTITTTNAHDVIFGSGANGGGPVLSPTSGWNGGNTISSGLAEYLITNVTGTFAASVTLGGSGSWVGCIAAFKSSGTLNTIQPSPFIVTVGGYNVGAGGRVNINGYLQYSADWSTRTNTVNASTNNTFYTDVHDINFTVGTGNPICTDVFLFACAQQNSLRNSILTGDVLTVDCLRTDLTGGGGIIQGVTCTGGQYALRHLDTYELVYRGCAFNGPVIYNGGFIANFVGCTFNNSSGSGFSAFGPGRWVGLNDCTFTSGTGLSVTNGFVPGTGTSGGTGLHLENVTWPSLANVPAGLQPYADATGKVAQYTNGTSPTQTIYYNGTNVSGVSAGINASINKSLYANPAYPRPGVSCVNVTSFGATGNGSTDDTAAINSAYAANLEVFFPVGTYKVTSSLMLSAGMKMFGCCPNRTIINITSSSPALVITGNGSAGVIICGVLVTQLGTGNCVQWNGDPSSQVLDTEWSVTPAVSTLVVFQSGGGLVENMWATSFNQSTTGLVINSTGALYLYSVQPEHYSTVCAQISGAQNVYWLNYESEVSPSYITVTNSASIFIQGVLCGNTTDGITCSNSNVNVFGVFANNSSSGVVENNGVFYGPNTAGVNCLDGFVVSSVPDTFPPTPDPPTGLTASTTLPGSTASSITLSWPTCTDNVTANASIVYLVEHMGGAINSFTQLTNPATGVASGNVTYVDNNNGTGLAASTAYSYRIRAKDAAGNISVNYSATVLGSTVTSSVGQKALLDPRFGFATHFGQGWSTNLMSLIAATGAGYIRDDLSSGQWEPTTGNFQISSLAQTWCTAAHNNGLKVVGIITGNSAYGGGPIAFAQANSNVTPNLSTVAVAFTGAQTTGNLNVVIIGWDNPSALTVISVADTKNGAYTSAIAQTNSGTISQRLYYFANIASATAGSNTVTVVLSGVASSPDLRILEYSGVALFNPIDVTATNLGNSTASTISITTVNATDLIVVGGTTSQSFNPVGAPFTRRIFTSPNNDIADDDIVSTVGTYTDSTSLFSSGTWVMQAVAFKMSSNYYTPTLVANRAAFIAQSGLVDVIEVLNEPNNAYQSFQGPSWLTKLPILTTAVTNAVRAVSSTVKVIGLGAQGSQIWGMAPSTTVDGIVYHPYDTGNSKAANDVPDTCFEQPSGANSTSSLVYIPWINICRGQTAIPLWETEWGVQQPDVNGAFTQDNQACYLVRRMLTSAGLGVEHTFIYEFMDNGSGDLFGVYANATTPKTSYSAVTNTIASLSGTQGTPASKPTISNVASGSTNAMGYTYQGPGKTVASSWFGNASPSSPEPASTCTIAFGTGLAYNNAVVLNPIVGSSVPLTTYAVFRIGNQVTVSGLPISDHPLLIILTESTPPRFLQRAINHLSASGAISCPVTTSLTSVGNLLVVYIGTQAAGSVISSVTDNKGNSYSLAYSNTAFNASLLCYHCLGCTAGVTTVTVLSSASVNSLNLDVTVYEFAGGADSDWFFDVDASAGSNSGGTTSVSSSPTSVTTQVNEVAIAACATNGTTTTAGTGEGWTGIVSGLNGWSEYEIVSSAGTYAASFTVAATGHAWVAGVGTWYALKSSFRPTAIIASTSSAGAIASQMAPATDAFVQRAQNSVANSGAISCGVSLAATQAGNLIVVYIGTLSAGSVITSVTDNKANTYSLAFSDTAFNSSILCYNCLGCIAGVTTVMVLSSAAVNANQLDVSVYEMSGIGTWSLDKFSVSGSNSGATTAATSGTTVSTTVANEVIIGACYANGTTVIAGTTGWTGQSA